MHFECANWKLQQRGVVVVSTVVVVVVSADCPLFSSALTLSSMRAL